MRKAERHLSKAYFHVLKSVYGYLQCSLVRGRNISYAFKKKTKTNSVAEHRLALSPMLLFAVRSVSVLLSAPERRTATRASDWTHAHCAHARSAAFLLLVVKQPGV